MGVTGIGAALALMLMFGSVDDPAADRLYGRVLTSDGRTVEGYIRWDRNESNWTDFLDGLKEIPADFVQEAERLDPEFAAAQRRQRSLVAFGVRLTWDEDDEADALTSTSAIRFGHLASLEALDSRSAMVTLRSGEQIRLSSSSTDIGRAMREIVVDVALGEDVEVEWSELERIDFVEAPASAPSPDAARLYGSVTTWGGLALTGYIAWDLDEILTSDLLDGREGREDYEVAFGDILQIDWESDRSARVLLKTGEELVLRGTNDVDRDNRGIEVGDPGFGRAIVRWEDFKSVRLMTPTAPVARPDFPPGAMLSGTVHALDGRVLEGEIRWDNDETQAWEVLDGWSGEVDLDIEFGAIREIDKVAPDRVVVTLRDGRTFELEDTDDVGEGNEGIFVKPEGRPRRLVRWRDLDRVVFVG
jgi:hypothetical protein